MTTRTISDCSDLIFFGSPEVRPLKTKKFFISLARYKGEHPCEPKFFGRAGAEPSSEPKKTSVLEVELPCEPKNFSILEGELPSEPKFFGSAEAEPSSEPKFSVVQEHDPSVRRILLGATLAVTNIRDISSGLKPLYS